MIEGSRGERWRAVARVFEGIPLLLPHFDLIRAIANRVEGLGARGLCAEAYVTWGPGRGNSGHLDLAFRLGGETWGVEVDNKTLKWRSLEKVRGSGVDIGVFVLRHAGPAEERSLMRCALGDRSIMRDEYIVTRYGIRAVKEVVG